MLLPVLTTYMITRAVVSVLVVVMSMTSVLAVKHSDFKSCVQSGFCSRNRKIAESMIQNGPIATWQAGDVKQPSSSTISFTLSRLDVQLKAEIAALDNGAIRFNIDPTVDRYRIPAGDVIEQETIGKNAFVSDEQSGSFKLSGTDLSLKLSLQPFSLSLVSESDGPLLHLNGKSLLHFETGKTFNLASLASGLSDDLWNEPYFSGLRQDSRPAGPNSMAMDISFPGSQALYGIPEHASSLALKSTRKIVNSAILTKSDPYRLFNLDVFEYELDSTMALYGAIPIMLGHNTAAKKYRSVGVFWNNPSETWVDVFEDGEQQQKLTHWMSESGSFNVYLLVGTELKQLQSMIKDLTGAPQLPPTFALGYHQCRWNYNNVADVLEVQEKFDENELPVDVLWLDIEHTDGKRYMSWHPRDFSDPLHMQSELEKRGRKLVTIVDPHLKKDPNWPVYRELVDRGLAVKSSDGKTTFEGNCWPGQSVWTDYTNPAARDWWAGLFSFEKYVNSTENLFIWNDMNEPSVFNSPEITMPRDNIHHGGVEHRDVHNLYGKYQQMSTFKGLVDRSRGQKRPFLLSRSFYAGSQKYGAIWTGDNAAKWDHLAASGPMLLSLGMVGYAFAGADVGGFFGNPTTDLLVRWYQAGAMQPFFRAHAHIDSKRREPYLFGEQVTASIRKVLRLRYSLLPLWYTAFEEGHRTGVPPMRSMIMEYPSDSSMLSVDDQWMVSSVLLFKPISSSFASQAHILLPRQSIWYNYFDLSEAKADSNSGKFTLSSPSIDQQLLFIRGGSIFARKDTPRRSTRAMIHDPYTLVVALDAEGKAEGSLYIDDGESFEYRDHNAFIRVQFKAILSKHDSLLNLEIKTQSSPVKLAANVNVVKLVVAHQNGSKEVKADISLASSSGYELKL